MPATPQLRYRVRMARLKLKHGSRKPILRERGGPRVRVKDKGGAIFLPDHEQQVRMIAMRGATDDEIADTFGVSREMFQRWRKTYPSFEKAIDQGRSKVDADMVYALYRNGTGFTYEEETTAGKDGHVVKIKRYARPDTSAIKYWLENRQPENWATTTRLTGAKKGETNPNPLAVETRNDIIASIVALIAPKPDGQTKPHTEDKRRE